MKFSSLVIGADPEFMLIEKGIKTNSVKDLSSKLISAIGKIPGSKHDPKEVKKGLTIHADNVNLEAGFTPASTFKDFINRMKKLTKYIEETDFDAVVLAAANFPKKELDNEEAKIFGCEPDFNAYTREMNIIDPLAGENTLRTAAGHIHVGYNDDIAKSFFASEDIGQNIENIIKAVQSMDLFVGVTNVLLDKDPTSKKRKQLYGKAGSHRPKEYGFEYRALNNYWLSDKKIAKIVFYLTKFSVIKAYEKKSQKFISDIGENTIQDIINEHNRKEARNIYKKYIQKLLPKKYQEDIDELSKRPFTLVSLTQVW